MSIAARAPARSPLLSFAHAASLSGDRWIGGGSSLASRRREDQCAKKIQTMETDVHCRQPVRSSLCPRNRTPEIEAQHRDGALAILREDFADVHSAEFRNVEGVPHLGSLRTIDLHVLHERAQKDSSRIDWNLWLRCNKGISCHFAESFVDVKLFFQRVKGIEAKEQIVFELELNGASTDF